LKLDMLMREGSLSKSSVDGLNEIKNEAIKIKTVVKKMLEISDVVETNYVKNEKMLDIHHTSKKDEGARATGPVPESSPEEIAAGFEDYNNEERKPQAPASSAMTEDSSGNHTPGFEDYLDQQHKEMQKNSTSSSSVTDNPGFEDYLE
ncbi:MAG: hypothetical protein JXM72_09385, partial [Deltaproteobacteria bacterium]|nr:hypothetical protein [Deltaproteobacteria bacterium]